MIKRKKLGQHFLNSDHIARTIVSEAAISKDDTVFEIGTGLGILTPLLCKNAKRVISVDADRDLVARVEDELSGLDNLELEAGDGFRKDDVTFSVFVSNLPYSRSKDAIEWLAQKDFSHGVVMVQKEFAEKLTAKNMRERRAISVIANHCFDISEILTVGKNNFAPPPKIDSVVLKIRKKATLDKPSILTINRMFSYRRKTVKNILKQFNQESEVEKRVDDLSGNEIVDLANQITAK